MGTDSFWRRWDWRRHKESDKRNRMQLSKVKIIWEYFQSTNKKFF
jgi:hypothetical protein